MAPRITKPKPELFLVTVSSWELASGGTRCPELRFTLHP